MKIILANDYEIDSDNANAIKSIFLAETKKGIIGVSNLWTLYHWCNRTQLKITIYPGDLKSLQNIGLIKDDLTVQEDIKNMALCSIRITQDTNGGTISVVDPRTPFPQDSPIAPSNSGPTM